LDGCVCGLEDPGSHGALQLGNGGEPGYVHLAGYTDKFREQNVHVVWDGTQAGEWHPSTLAWKEFIARQVAGQARKMSAVDR
jgi:hypothetical protein